MHPSHDPYASIWREPGSEGERLHHHFADAAKRLASTFPKDPSHEILMPWLYLNRHAIELALKYVIVEATQLRLARGHHGPSLEREAVAKRLRSTHSHSIAALGHASFPARASTILAAIDGADPSGEAFRYSATLPHDDVAMDFFDLNDSSFPARASTILAAIDGADPSGEAFRYSATLPHDDVAMDFFDLNDSLTYAFDIAPTPSTSLTQWTPCSTKT